jgi:DNA-binding NtrC family response regulator
LGCTILSIAFRDQIAEDTQRLLEQNSFSVETVSDFKRLEECCTQGKFDLALVESEIMPKVKRAIGLLLRTHCPWAPVVEMFSGKPHIAGAEPIASNQFVELVPTINRTLSKRQLKSA